MPDLILVLSEIFTENRLKSQFPDANPINKSNNFWNGLTFQTLYIGPVVRRAQQHNSQIII